MLASRTEQNSRWERCTNDADPLLPHSFGHCLLGLVSQAQTPSEVLLMYAIGDGVYRRLCPPDPLPKKKKPREPMTNKTKGLLIATSGLSVGPIIGVLVDNVSHMGLLLGSCISVGLLGLGLLIGGLFKAFPI